MVTSIFIRIWKAVPKVGRQTMNKENKKVNDRELKLIFVLGGIVLFFLIYQFGYLNVQKANENLKKP